MGITYHEASACFKLDAGSTSYVIGIMGEEKYATLLYYGSYVPDNDLRDLYGPYYDFRPSVYSRDKARYMDAFRFEYPVCGCGDFREHCLEIETPAGHRACELHYVSHRISKGKEPLSGLPATYDNEGACMTLELILQDPVISVDVKLTYTVFEQLDVITRSVQVINNAESPLTLHRVLSACIDLPRRDLSILTLHGGWENECTPMRASVTSGRYVCESARGESSAQANPFMALMDRSADDEHGEVYAMNFVYSGNFYASAEGYHFGGTRMVMGVNPSTFSWKLNSGESFQAPEVVMVHSSAGIGEMTRTFHRLYRNHLMRGPWVHRDRPVLLNSWEGCYFDFTTERLLSLADSAKAEGVELLVLDDGWFGDRSDDERALGDWYVNEEKLPGGLKYLSNEIHKRGLLFGLWVEPEMISQNSDLFREHPDWAISIPNRDPSLFRCQLVLDYSRKEVRDTVYGQIKEVLQDAQVDYVKWDMNRYLTDLGSVALEAERMQELSHRYILGVYEIQERLLSDFPDLLLENCSAGGSRFDAGMLYYSPQIWASDDSDAIERLRIQYGTSLVYPLSSMGAHISAVPNHQTGRNVPMTTRGYVALSGTFGFELDPDRISNEDREKMRGQIELYHRFSALVREGDLYRVGTVLEEQDWDAWEVVADNKREALVTYIQVHSRPGVIRMARLIKLKGLDSERIYRVEKIRDDAGNQMHDMLSAKGKETLTLSGAALMNGGVWIERMTGDYRGLLLHLVALD